MDIWKEIKTEQVKTDESSMGLRIADYLIRENKKILNPFNFIVKLVCERVPHNTKKCR
jgi:hypothetical protein